MSEDLTIGKDIEVSQTKLTSGSSSTPGTEGPKPWITEYVIEGNTLITSKVYRSPEKQNLISNFCLEGLIEYPHSYEDELMDEFLKIGREYESVDYPSSEVLENNGEYNGEKNDEYPRDDQEEDSNQLRSTDTNSKSRNREESISKDTGPRGIGSTNDGINPEEIDDLLIRDSYNDYDFEYLNQSESYDSEVSNSERETDNSLSQGGVTIDHDTISEGLSKKKFHKDEPHLGKGLDGDISRHEQPREKALRLGIDVLSDAELLALIFGTGIKGQNVLEMSRQILADNMNRLSHLARLSPQELTMRYKGIGQAKAIMLCAAMALGIRAERDAHHNQMRQIDSSLKAYHLLRPQLQWIEHEEFWVIFLSKSNSLKNCCCISRGGISETVVDVRIVIQRALQESASSMILVHNHPGSLLVPSRQDDELTLKIAEGARFFDIKVLDHIIIGASGYYSFKEHNHLKF